MNISPEAPLDDYVDYLLRRRLVPPYRACFCLQWVRRYLAYAALPGRPGKAPREGFVQALRDSGKWEERQVELAELAVRLYQDCAVDTRRVAA